MDSKLDPPLHSVSLHQGQPRSQHKFASLLAPPQVGRLVESPTPVDVFHVGMSASEPHDLVSAMDVCAIQGQENDLENNTTQKQQTENRGCKHNPHQTGVHAGGQQNPESNWAKKAIASFV